MLEKMKVLVLAGGNSTEREVSLVSGRMIEKALRERGHEVEFVDVDFGMAPAAWGDFFARCKAADIVFLGLHGVPGEDGRLQGMFDLLKIPYTGAGYLASAVCMDKVVTKRLLREAGLPVPADYASPEAVQSFPVVVKTSTGGSSVGVYIAHNQRELEEACEKAAAFPGKVMLEEYIPGREFTLTVMDGEALPVIEIIPKSSFYDYEHKYEPGMTDEICPAELSAEKTKALQALAIRAFEALCLNAYARFDLRMDEQGRFYFLEANTLPGMTPTSLLPLEGRTLGMDFGEVCERIIGITLPESRS